MTEETTDKVKEVFKSDMKTAEEMNELVTNHDNGDISESSVEVVEEMVQKIDDPVRQKCMFATCFQIGNAIGNQELSEFAGNQLKKWEQEYGQ